jgi:putative ABC transport system permease protein
MRKSPPKFANRLLSRFCNVEFLEEIEGDLNEQFQERCEKDGVFLARLFYIRDVLQSLRRYPSKRSGPVVHHRLPATDLLQQFFKVSFRHIIRSKTSGIINVGGFAISLTSFLLIAAYIIDESTYDRFHQDAENVYRIGYSYKRYGDGVEETDARAPGLWSIALKESMPEVQTFTRFSRFGYPGTVRYSGENKVFVEQQFFWVDSTYADIFYLDLMSGGSVTKILKDPDGVILTEATAKKYFGDQPPLGKTLVYSRDGLDIPLTVAGVMRAYPSNSHFHPDFIASNLALMPLWKRANEDRVSSWRDAFTYSYLRLDEGTNPVKLELALRKVFHAHLGDEAKLIWPSVVKMTDIHFTPGKLIELENAGNKSNLYIFGSIGILVLIIASINYMNLATARSMRRSKEVGLRKTLGVRRSALIIQFVGESIVITAIAFTVSIIILGLCLPYFNNLTAKDFSLVSFLSPATLVPILTAILMLAIVSGIYPAFYLSSFRPVEVLKGQLQTGRGAENFRRVLVVFQFTITLLLLAGTMAIDKQLNFLNQAKLAEHQEEMLTVRLTDMIDPNKINPLIDELKRKAIVADVSIGTEIPRQDHYGWIDTRVTAKALGPTEFVWQTLDVAPNFPDVFNLELVAGRTFVAMTDSLNVVINESALKDLRIDADEALGLRLQNNMSTTERTIIGVVKDFNYTSARKKIEPLVINCSTADAETLYVKLSSADYKRGVQITEDAWKKISPLSPFEYSFLDEHFDKLYKLERQTNSILKCFAALAITIACLGLFGLASFVVEQRTKEIGIRKVLGASVNQILVLLTSRFMRLIVIALVVGTPCAYLAISLWLNSFAYKIDINASYFVIPALFIFGISCLTVTIETVRAAFANPVLSIKDN